MDVIVPKVGRRLRQLGTVTETFESGRRVFNFRPRTGDEIWKFIPSNSIACNAITVDEFSRSLQGCGELEALWDEIEGHPVIMISVAAASIASVTPPLFVAKRLPDDAKRRQ